MYSPPLSTYQTHLLAYYTVELAQRFHQYYTSNKVIDNDNRALTKNRLFLVSLVRQSLATCLELLGVSTPERM